MSTSCLAPLSPGALRALDPRLLLEFLAPHRDLLAAQGLDLPPVASPDGPAPALDCDRLFALLSRTDTRLPPDLTDGLHHVAALSSADHMATLLAHNERHGLGLSFAADATPADVALRFWMACPDLVERRAAESEIDRASTLTLFAPARRTAPPLACPDLSRLTALSGMLAPWFEARRRGRACEVFAVERAEGIWFVVARGDAVRCTPARRLDDDRPAVVRYRPERHDLILFRPATGDLGIRAAGLRLIDHYRATFGAFLFGEPDHFESRARFDLSPLALHGRASLACGDFAGEIDWVRLIGLTEESEFAPRTRTIREADDLFTYFERRGKTLNAPALVSATFRVKFTAAKRPRTFSIRSACKVRQARDVDAFLLEAWLRARGFILSPAIATQVAA
jgi:hypothetical protein